MSPVEPITHLCLESLLDDSLRWWEFDRQFPSIWLNYFWFILACKLCLEFRSWRNLGSRIGLNNSLQYISRKCIWLNCVWFIFGKILFAQCSLHFWAGLFCLLLYGIQFSRFKPFCLKLQVPESNLKDLGNNATKMFGKYVNTDV